MKKVFIQANVTRAKAVLYNADNFARCSVRLQYHCFYLSYHNSEKSKYRRKDIFFHFEPVSIVEQEFQEDAGR